MNDLHCSKYSEVQKYQTAATHKNKYMAAKPSSRTKDHRVMCTRILTGNMSSEDAAVSNIRDAEVMFDYQNQWLFNDIKSTPNRAK